MCIPSTAFSTARAALKSWYLIVKELGQTAIAITDHGSMYGCVYLYKECLKQGIKPIIG